MKKIWFILILHYSLSSYTPSKKEVKLSLLYSKDNFALLCKKVNRWLVRDNKIPHLFYFYQTACLLNLPDNSKEKNLETNYRLKLATDAYIKMRDNPTYQLFGSTGLFIEVETKLKKDLLAELAYTLHHPENNKILQLTLLYLKLEPKNAGALLLKSMVELADKDPNAKKNLVYAYQVLEKSDTQYWLSMDNKVFELGVENYISYQQKNGGQKEIKILKEKTKKMKKY